MTGWTALAAIGLVAAACVGARADGVIDEAVPVAMADGTRLAADVVRPLGTGRVPAVVVMTPYGRATRMSQGGLKAFAQAGFATVLVDMRGSGASEGSRDGVFSAEERGDIPRILTWVARQRWSDGRVITTGVSYDANLAALSLVRAPKALVATVPRFIDFDTYSDLVLPGGVRNEMLLRGWGALTDKLNSATSCLEKASACGTIDNLKPLDGDTDYSLLRRALLDHQRDWHAYRDTMGYSFDDDVSPSGHLLRAGFLSTVTRALDETRVPVQIWGSWFDARTADSALAWYAEPHRSPVELYLGAWTHGGGSRVDPFLSGTHDDEPGAPVPPAVFLDFAQRALARPRSIHTLIHYYTAGAGIWRTTGRWPPSGVAPVRWRFEAGNGLDTATPVAGFDRYAVDYSASTGSTNRWTTQLGGGMVDYGDRRQADTKLLTYTSAPLAQANEITGAPEARLRLASTDPDPALFVYLEDVRADGKVVYLSEGELRVALRGGNAAANSPAGLSPSFRRADVAFLRPGETVDVGIRLTNVSAMIPRGDRLRIAIAGADADTFARYPADGAPVLTIYREASSIDIPQAAWKSQSRSP